MERTMTLPLIQNARRHGERVAVEDAGGSHTYDALLRASAGVAAALLGGRADLSEERIAFLVAPGFGWVATQWGIWRAGGIAVPLPLHAATPELEYILDDSRASILVSDGTAAAQMEPLAAARGLRTVACDGRTVEPGVELPEIALERRAMILYTSGTTSRPKGVVTTHANIAAQITSLVEAWEWSEQDSIVSFLPLHHVHGIVNIVSCALWSGARLHMIPRPDAGVVWELIGRGTITVLMAVPTVYMRLIAAWEAADAERRAELTDACKRMRLMVSGSAALPVSTLRRWEEISGHTLLERYGMTEIGMALSNSLHGTRVPGSVGRPLPGVQMRLADEGGQDVQTGEPGEIVVRGPAVFAEYWGKPEATRDGFRDGWFLTGDMAVEEGGVFRILGRTSVDILKSGGHKLSALEIEETLRMHPMIAECAVVGVPDAEWGERVGAALVLKEGCALDLVSLRLWCREKMANYKLPTRLLVVEALARNAMGKIMKPAVSALFQSSGNVESAG
jgi:malonyl-CoA/methylmalonyl-CoA synthetase